MKSVLPKMKAVSEATFQRAAEEGGSLSLPQHTKDAVARAATLEKEIGNLAQVTGAQELLEQKRQELKAIQPKLSLSTQTLKDHGDVVNALRELQEKNTGKQKKLEENKTKL